MLNSSSIDADSAQLLIDFLMKQLRFLIDELFHFLHRFKCPRLQLFLQFDSFADTATEGSIDLAVKHLYNRFFIN